MPSCGSAGRRCCRVAHSSVGLIAPAPNANQRAVATASEATRLPKLGDAQRSEIIALEAPQRAIAATGEAKGVGCWEVGHALRLREAVNPTEKLALAEIDHAEATVAELSHEQTMPGEVDGKVINAPTHRS
jgi:hypothetical protein